MTAAELLTSPLVTLVSSTLYDAIQQVASGIHLERVLSG